MSPRSTRGRIVIGAIAGLVLLLGVLALGASLGGDEATTVAAGTAPSGDFDY